MSELKLKPEIKALWTGALRSGAFGQCASKLADGHGSYCCLGVLSELAARQGVIEEGLFCGSDEATFVRYDNESGTLPRKVADWAFEPFVHYSVDSWDNPMVRTDERMTTLAELNDTGKSFNEIADIIEEQL